MPPRPNGPRLSMKESLQKNDKKTLKRLLSYIVGHHKLVFGAVLVCILISSCTVVVSSLFLEILGNKISKLVVGNFSDKSCLQSVAGDSHRNVCRGASYEFFKHMYLFQRLKLFFYLVIVRRVEVNGHSSQKYQIHRPGLVKFYILHILPPPIRWFRPK